jgi:hypothetical protein
MTMLCYFAKCHYAECHILFTILLNVIMPSVIASVKMFIELSPETLQPSPPEINFIKLFFV